MGSYSLGLGALVSGTPTPATSDTPTPATPDRPLPSSLPHGPSRLLPPPPPPSDPPGGSQGCGPGEAAPLWGGAPGDGGRGRALPPCLPSTQPGTSRASLPMPVPQGLQALTWGSPEVGVMRATGSCALEATPPTPPVTSPCHPGYPSGAPAPYPWESRQGLRPSPAHLCPGILQFRGGQAGPGCPQEPNDTQMPTAGKGTLTVYLSSSVLTQQGGLGSCAHPGPAAHWAQDRAPHPLRAQDTLVLQGRPGVGHPAPSPTPGCHSALAEKLLHCPHENPLPTPGAAALGQVPGDSPPGGQSTLAHAHPGQDWAWGN